MSYDIRKYWPDDSCNGLDSGAVCGVNRFTLMPLRTPGADSAGEARQQDNASVTEVSDEYGISRPTYYQAKANFDTAGIAGLVPKKPGPRGPRKVHGEILAFLQEQLVPGEPVRARELARLIRNELGIEVHPRTIERALKKTAG